MRERCDIAPLPANSKPARESHARRVGTLGFYPASGNVGSGPAFRFHGTGSGEDHLSA